MNSIHTGKLYVVATPIGNLEDMSYRACSVLRQVDWVAAEDTRQSKILLDHYQINKKLISLHAFNEKSRVDHLLDLLKQGQNGALITDAGTPCISDPGALLIQAMHLNQITVVPIPGPCALITALSVSGFSTTEFMFTGFLPSKSSSRKAKLEALKKQTCPIIFYESPHRIADMIQDCNSVLGSNRKVMMARELTKKYETLYLDQLGNLANNFRGKTLEERGEFVVIVDGCSEDSVQQQNINDENAVKILTTLLTEVSVKTAVRLASEITGYSKNKLYDLAVNLQHQQHNKS